MKNMIEKDKNSRYSYRKITDPVVNNILADKDSEKIAEIITEILEKEFNQKNKEGTVMADSCFWHFGRHYNKTKNKNNELIPKRAYFVVIDNKTQEVVGGCGYAVKENEVMKTFEVQRMFLKKDARGSGIGSKLLDMILTEAFENGNYEQAYLDTRDDMIAAVALYERRGFEKSNNSNQKGLHSNTNIIMYLKKERWEEFNKSKYTLLSAKL